MSRIRVATEADLAALEYLHRRALPDWRVPDLTPETNFLELLLEDEDGDLEMAIVGQAHVTAALLADPARPVSQESWQRFEILEEATMRRLVEVGAADWLFQLALPPSLRGLGGRLRTLQYVRPAKGWRLYTKTRTPMECAERNNGGRSGGFEVS